MPRPSRRSRAKALLIGGAAVALMAGCATTTPPETGASSPAVSMGSPSSGLDARVRERTLDVPSATGNVRVAYCGNGSLEQKSAAVTNVIVVVHGDSRNSCDYANYVERAARTAGQVDSTLTIAPRFITEADDVGGRRLARWTESGWKAGDASIGRGPSGRAALSSYAVVDEIVAQLAVGGRFPELDQVTIAGHSAGGQFVNRYAATTTSDGALPSTISRHYVVANPSSYLYLTPLRPVADGLAPVSAKQERTCSDFNTYKYGLRGLNDYAGRSSPQQIKARYAASRVTYLLGSEDTSTDTNLDVGCEALLQGPQRLARGRSFFESLGVLFGQGVYTRQREVIVTGVGHDGEAMFNSRQGRDALFTPPR